MRKLINVAAVFAAVAALGLAQKKPKSDKETQAIQAIQKAKSPDEVIAAVENLITKFADTDFKSPALLAAAESSDQKGDYIKAISYGDLAIEADPKNFDAMLLVGAEVAQHTRDNDLDKTEKLAKSEKYVKDAMTIITTAEKPGPQLTDAQWEAVKKNGTARGHFDLGLIAMVRKKPDVAAAEYKLAVDGSDQPDPVWMVRLGDAYNNIGKFDDAIAVLDKVIAMTDINAQVKSIAQSLRASAEKAKNGKK